MNRLSLDAEEMAIRCLSEGNSIRSTERLTGIHRDTIMKLLVRVGSACATLLDEKMRALNCEEIEIDELWTFVGKKQRRLRAEDNKEALGDFWVYTSIDPTSKIMPSYLVGKRNGTNTRAFIDDLASRLNNRVLISSDAFSSYAEAIDTSFGGEVDYAVVVKAYEAEPIGPGRYAPPRVSSLEKKAVFGNPDMDRVGTSRVECSNRTMRMRCRRFTRLTNAFSRKVENLTAAVALYFADYNFVRRHATIGMVPAVKAGIIDSAMTARDLVERAR